MNETPANPAEFAPDTRLLARSGSIEVTEVAEPDPTAGPRATVSATSYETGEAAATPVSAGLEVAIPDPGGDFMAWLDKEQDKLDLAA